MGNEGKLTFSLTHFRPRIISGVGTQGDLFTLVRTCVRRAGRNWNNDSFPPLTQAQIGQIAIVLTKLDSEEVDGASWDDALKVATTSAEVEDFAAIAIKQCHPEGGIVTNDLPLIRLYALSLIHI